MISIKEIYLYSFDFYAGIDSLTVWQSNRKSTLKQNGQVVLPGQSWEKTFSKLNIYERQPGLDYIKHFKNYKIFLLIVFLPPVEKLLDQNMRRWEENCYCCHDCERRENDQTKPKNGSILLEISLFFNNERFDGQNEAEWLQQLISKSVKGFFSQTGSNNVLNEIKVVSGWCLECSNIHYETLL